MQLINNKTNDNYTVKQLKLPLVIEKLINISDSVYTFCDVMDHIDLNHNKRNRLKLIAWLPVIE